MFSLGPSVGLQYQHPLWKSLFSSYSFKKKRNFVFLHVHTFYKTGMTVPFFRGRWVGFVRRTRVPLVATFSKLNECEKFFTRQENSIKDFSHKKEEM